MTKINSQIKEISSFEISLHDSLAFAKLSGDYNPLHVSPSFARRTPFGATVVHGVHALVRAILLVSRRLQQSSRLARLQVWFREPISHSSTIDVVQVERQCNDFRLELKMGPTTCQVIVLSIVSQTNGVDSDLVCSTYNESEVQVLTLQESANATGSVPLQFDNVLAAQLFSQNNLTIPHIQIAQLLALSRIVGMECPGLNSTLTHLAADFDDISVGSDSAIKFTSCLASSALSKVRIDAVSVGLRSKVESLYRPPPVTQPSFGEVSDRVFRKEFSGDRCLVIGGSRGLGEVTSKILAAGGASVGLSYYSEEKDAVRIRDELRNAGCESYSFYFNVLQPSISTHDFPADWKPTKLFYFATPYIGLTRTAVWDELRFEKFCKYYVGGLVHSVANVRGIFGLRELDVFYPSSVILDSGGALAAEYAASKAASESVCHFLNAQSGIRCFSARLPRILTDQTNSFVSAPAEDAVDTLIGVFQKMKNNSGGTSL